MEAVSGSTSRSVYIVKSKVLNNISSNRYSGCNSDRGLLLLPLRRSCQCLTTNNLSPDVQDNYYHVLLILIWDMSLMCLEFDSNYSSTRNGYFFCEITLSSFNSYRHTQHKLTYLETYSKTCCLCYKEETIRHLFYCQFARAI